MNGRSARAWVGLALAALLAGGCGPKPVFHGPVAPEPIPGMVAGPEPRRGPGPLTAYADSTVAERAQALEALAEEWVGTPYRRGGTGSRGVDCSALACRVLGELGVDLPRTTSEQRRIGQAVSRDEMEPGDLLFFRLGSSRVNHVGVVLDRERFLHASTSRGVVVESMDHKYFARSLVEIRRVWGS